MIPLYTTLFFSSLLLFNLFTRVLCQENGNEICVEGFVMDKFCVDLGTLLDKPDLISLQYPNEHSLHCLVDVKSCYESAFLILADPVGGSSLYTVAYQVDDSGRDILIALARAAGLAGNYPACGTCTNEADYGLLQGFRAEVFGVVTDSSSNPPLLTVRSAFVSNGREATDICVLQQISDSPTRSPQMIVPVALPMNALPMTTMPVTATPSGIAALPITIPSSLPSRDVDAQESSNPSIEPILDVFSEAPSQIETSIPSYAPDLRSATSAPVTITPPSPTATATTNNTADIAPTPAPITEVSNRTSSADAIQPKIGIYSVMVWCLSLNLLRLVSLSALWYY